MAAANEPKPGPRLDREARREALLDVAAALVAEESVEAVTMEAIAERARVSRPLVYKHFGGRDELLAAVYRREASRLHETISREVGAAGSLEEMFRALVREALRASADHGALFGRLRSAGGWGREVAREQRARDAQTANAFIRRARTELGVDSAPASVALTLLLGMVDQILGQFRRDPTKSRRALLEEGYMTIVSATLAAVGAPKEPGRPSDSGKAAGSRASTARSKV